VSDRWVELRETAVGTGPAAHKEKTMAEESNRVSCSRRRFLNGGAAFVAGGLIGSATGMVSAASKRPQQGTAELPWPWAKIDPMEAGSRAFRYYHDAGG
jgi:hypothetical protein